MLLTREGWSDWDNDEFYFTLPERGKWQAVNFRFSVLEAPSAAMFLHTTYTVYDTVPRFSPYPVFQFSSWMLNSQEPSTVINPLRFRGLDFTSPRYVWLDQGILGSYGSRWAYQIDFLVTRAPEPGTFALLSLGLVGLGLARRRGVS